jgi:hypothetical protein
LRLRRTWVGLRWWHPNYIERTGIERVDRVEDFDLGPSLTLRLGAAPKFLGSSADEGAFLARLDGGASTPFGFGIFRSSIDGRWRRRVEEVVQQASGRWIAQAGTNQVLEAAVSGIAGRRMPRTFQVVAGGLNGLRAYPVHAVAGTRMVRWNVEARRMLLRDIFQFVSIGAATFLDGARAWGTGAEGTPPFQCAGVGIRLAPPRAALGPVIRVDLAWPLSPTRDGKREAVVSIGSAHAF